jgi:hypothetical protein
MFKINLKKKKYILSVLCILIIILIIILIYLFYPKINENYTENYKQKYTAIIIEPREHNALQFVLNNFLENLSDEWNIIIFHGNNNEKFVLNIINNDLRKYRYRIKLENLNIDNLTLTDYNNLLISKKIYAKIPTEVFLIFQTDSIICKKYRNYINNFIKYDYVGAPWSFGMIGNGGLSIRRKSKMLEIINKCEYKNEPEDYYFSQSCSEIPRNLPTFDEAKEFSVEGVYSDKSFGVHKPWMHLNILDNLNINEYCDGLLDLIDLNN